MVTNTITSATNVATSSNVLSGVCIDWMDHIPHSEYEALKKAAAMSKVPEIKDVIYNPPATIVHWMDGEKTVIKVQEGDTYDPEKGLLLAFAKRLFGNDNTFNKVMHKWCNVEEINRTLELRELKKIKKQANATKKRTEKLITDLDESIREIEERPEFKVGDQVVMYQHIDEDNRWFEPDIGTVGTITHAFEDSRDVVVQWPAGSTEEGGGDTYWLPKASVRHINK